MTETPPVAFQRAFVTPEGVDLRLVVGSAGQRAAAFLIDAAIIVGVLIVGTIVLVIAGLGASSVGGAEVVAVVWLLAFFFLRNFYFAGFEMTAAAATPGKRLMGLRLAARNGGRLTAESVFARNAMRELEVFLPLSLLFAPMGGGIDGWLVLVALLWSAIFVFFPLFNRDRLRVGDIVGGTWVVRTPRRALLRDISEYGSSQLSAFRFSTAQLDVYGAHEVQILEQVLRQRDRRTLRAVSDRICSKIGWERRDEESDESFLSAYYAAARQRLEQRLLMGVRRKNKFDTV